MSERKKYQHFTDKEKKKIIADYVETGVYAKTARKFKTTADTVRRIVLTDPETSEKTKRKKEENTKDVIAHMKAKTNAACSLLDAIMAEMSNPDKLKRASLIQLATAYGIIVDKYTAVTANNGSDDLLKKLDETLEKIGGVI